jgi:hypothetical protein
MELSFLIDSCWDNLAFWRLFPLEILGTYFIFGPAVPSERSDPMAPKSELEQKWKELSEAAKQEAEKLPFGKEREALMRKARQLETASQVNRWLSSPGLAPPN